MNYIVGCETEFILNWSDVYIKMKKKKKGGKACEIKCFFFFLGISVNLCRSQKYWQIHP